MVPFAKLIAKTFSARRPDRGKKGTDICMNLTDSTDSMEDSSCQMLIKSPNAVTISRNFF